MGHWRHVGLCPAHNRSARFVRPRTDWSCVVARGGAEEAVVVETRGHHERPADVERRNYPLTVDKVCMLSRMGLERVLGSQKYQNLPG